MQTCSSTVGMDFIPFLQWMMFLLMIEMYLYYPMRKYKVYAWHEYRLHITCCGLFLFYSLSSSCQCLKVEPYLIEASEDNTYVKVTHMSAYNTTHRGVGLFNNHQNGYIFFNERESPQMALFSIYLQLPMYDFPPFLKGLYLSLDYNRNPIARRILFVKQGDSTDMEEFLELKGELVPLDKLTELQKKYYDYTCQEGDCIRTCMVPSPQLNENDLEREKKILSL